MSNGIMLSKLDYDSIDRMLRGSYRYEYEVSMDLMLQGERITVEGREHRIVYVAENDLAVQLDGQSHLRMIPFELVYCVNGSLVAGFRKRALGCGVSVNCGGCVRCVHVAR